LEDYYYMETRYKMLTKSNPEAARMLLEMAQKDVQERWKLYEHMAAFGSDKSDGAKQEN
jgi:pyruvate-ferredoxin/flavodoxin oxidoreductase